MIKSGRKEKGLEWAERAYTLKPDLCGYNVACAFVLGGETERAFDVLEQWCQSNTIHKDWLEHDSDWDAARDHPRYAAILDRLS